MHELLRPVPRLFHILESSRFNDKFDGGVELFRT